LLFSYLLATHVVGRRMDAEDAVSVAPRSGRYNEDEEEEEWHLDVKEDDIQDIIDIKMDEIKDVIDVEEIAKE
jgi:hypothetical protein